MSRRRGNLKSGNDSFICEVSRVMMRDAHNQVRYRSTLVESQTSIEPIGFLLLGSLLKAATDDAVRFRVMAHDRRGRHLQDAAAIEQQAAVRGD